MASSGGVRNGDGLVRAEDERRSHIRFDHRTSESAVLKLNFYSYLMRFDSLLKIETKAVLKF